jgi:hypothetical protein
MPAFCRPWWEGGVGFDFRLQMAIADKWIEVRALAGRRLGRPRPRLLGSRSQLLAVALLSIFNCPTAQPPNQPKQPTHRPTKTTNQPTNRPMNPGPEGHVGLRLGHGQHHPHHDQQALRRGVRGLRRVARPGVSDYAVSDVGCLLSLPPPLLQHLAPPSTP